MRVLPLHSATTIEYHKVIIRFPAVERCTSLPFLWNSLSKWLKTARQQYGAPHAVRGVQYLPRIMWAVRDVVFCMFRYCSIIQINFPGIESNHMNLWRTCNKTNEYAYLMHSHFYLSSLGNGECINFCRDVQSYPGVHTVIGKESTKLCIVYLKWTISNGQSCMKNAVHQTRPKSRTRLHHMLHARNPVLVFRIHHDWSLQMYENLLINYHCCCGVYKQIWVPLWRPDLTDMYYIKIIMKISKHRRKHATKRREDLVLEIAWAQIS